MSEYKGKTISLISQADLRYVGVLEDIDGTRGTISLANVRCLGTEDRVSDPTKVVYPSNEVYQRFQLTGDSVKALNILEVSPDQVQPVAIPNGPQIPLIPVAQAPVAPVAAAPVQRAQPVQAPAQATQPPPQQRTHPTQPTQTTQPIQSAPVQSAPVQSAPLQSTSAPVAGPEETSTEFDFAANNNKFEAEHEKRTDAPTSYNKKSSFFDSLSSSTEEPALNRRARWQEQQKTNLDTFGESARSEEPSRDGYRGRGRGRGGRRRNNYGRDNQSSQDQWQSEGQGNRRNGRQGRGGRNNRDRDRDQSGSYNSAPEWAF